MAEEDDVSVHFPRLEFCTDNGAMIAYAGCQRLLAGQSEPPRIASYPRWSLAGLPPL
jgi:N6-L-threonylcarbamoyladenine synthase